MHTLSNYYSLVCIILAVLLRVKSNCVGETQYFNPEGGLRKYGKNIFKNIRSRVLGDKLVFLYKYGGVIFTPLPVM